MKNVWFVCGLLAGPALSACGDTGASRARGRDASGGAESSFGGAGGGPGGASSTGGAVSASGGSGEGGRSGGAPSEAGGAASSTGGATGPGGHGGCAGPFFASELVEASLPTPRNGSDAHGRDLLPEIVFGPPGSAAAVASLGNGGSITVSFGPARIVDGPGVDFIVFENPFPGNVELATVSVSADGIDWYTFPCVAEQKRTDSPLTDYGHCAGWRAVGPAGSDPTDPGEAGGDPYDLADLGIVDLPPLRYLRVTDRADLVEDPDDPTSPKSDSFDLNAVSLVHATCP